MSLSIEIRQVGQVRILELSGRLSIFEQNLRETAWQCIERGDRFLLINLANISYVDNSGLGQLCWIYTVLQNRGGVMKLLRVTPRTRKLLNITRLDTVFELYESEAEAVASFRAPKAEPLTRALSAV